MHWTVLILSGLFEGVWAIALDRSEGFTRLWPSVAFFAALAVSMGGLAWALRGLPVGTAYAAWVAVGVIVALVYSLLAGEEPFTWLKMAFIAMIIGGVVGLKAVG
ncbi:ligand-binding protein SH3 [Corynebacterium sphenisci DSM 44792]|uniref:Ligand-binding protein SH3 n=1 Tax=Corynebacterium sphenisci DSM 44792 TaxID=1437874 RepID=A0A1L7CWN8_9CORY|nr:multidrug efflux SMR transporter [Corynebacterium sphenisci]APT90230.1 ligand-binding protein SH3 [Corynebacterium sphenisci DSM 44792]